MSEQPTTTFESLGLHSQIVATLADLGYEAPTPIQAQTIPLLLSGSDVIGQAQTGTGKTAAFALPILNKIDLGSHATQALVLTPTRELAMQVAEAIHTYAKRIGPVTVQPIYGGAPIGLQLRHLKRGVQVVVGTPGRVIDHLGRGSLDLSAVSMLVLDEADEMLRMGFLEDVEKILSAAPEGRQIALFSATMPNEVKRIAKTHLSEPQRVEIEHKAMTAPAIEQRFLNVSENQKLAVLTQILELEASDAVLIFRRTKLGAAELAEKLEARGFAAVALHGDMNQSMRETVVRKLRSGQVEIVVATDVAARGLDVEQIAHVVNYDIPNDVEAYVHRVGRTGRAGRSGIATLFVTPRERRMLRDIERYTKSTIAPMKIPTQADVAAKRTALLKESIRGEIGRGDLDLYLQLVEQLVDEGPFDIAEVAAAAARLSSGAKEASGVAEAVPPPEPDRKSGRGAKPSAGRSAERPRPKSGPPRDTGEPKVQLMIGIGKAAGIRPADVVGSIANEANISGSDIGPIDIRDEFTLVMIPEKYQEHVVSALQSARFRGNRFDIKVAPAESPFHRPKPERSGKPADRPAPSRAPRKAGPGKPSYKSKTEGKGPAKGKEKDKSAKPAKSPFYKGIGGKDSAKGKSKGDRKPPKKHRKG